MDITAEHAGGDVVLELDEGCRSVAAPRRIISAALPHLREDGFDVTVQGRAVEDVDVRGLEVGAKIQVVESRRAAAVAQLCAEGYDVSADGLRGGLVLSSNLRLSELYLDAADLPRHEPLVRDALLCLHLTGKVVLPVCKLFLSRGYDVNAIGLGNVDAGQSLTALHVAAMLNRSKYCALLLQHGADVNARDKEGITPLHFGTLPQVDRERGPALRELLLRYGADMWAKDKFGRSPLDMARDERSREGIVPFNALDQFVEHGAPKEAPKVTNPKKQDSDVEADETDG